MAPMKVLYVAEKPSIAKSITHILSQNDYTTVINLNCKRNGINKYCKNYCFTFSYQGTMCEVVVTSVLGHLVSYDFIDGYSDWKQDPGALFEAPLQSFVKKVL